MLVCTWNCSPIINTNTHLFLCNPQIARAKQIKSHFLQKTVNEQSDVRKAAEEGAKGVIVSLGLIKSEGDDDK